MKSTNIGTASEGISTRWETSENSLSNFKNNFTSELFGQISFRTYVP